MSGGARAWQGKRAEGRARGSTGAAQGEALQELLRTNAAGQGSHLCTSTATGSPAVPVDRCTSASCSRRGNGALILSSQHKIKCLCSKSRTHPHQPALCPTAALASPAAKHSVPSMHSAPLGWAPLLRSQYIVGWPRRPWPRPRAPPPAAPPHGQAGRHLQAMRPARTRRAC